MSLPPDIRDMLDRAADHLGGDIIAAYVDNALAADELGAAKLHLGACPICRERLAIVAEALEVDTANSGRIDARAQHIAKAKTSPAPTVPSASEAVLDALRDWGRGAVDRTRDWIGSLSAWTPRSAAAGVAMRAGSSASGTGYAGVEAPLEMFFAADVLRTELAWAKNALTLTAAYDGDRITDLRAGVHAGPSVVAAASIVVRIGRQDAAGVTLILTQDRPSAMATETPLTGELTAMTASVSVRMGGQ